ncbi:MAG TPA: hypothetical protein VLX85_02085 [Stellaceae bacterium]|nr:hypothetical protein [Stellaceae bacterium]
MVDATQQPARPFAWRSLLPSWPLIVAIAAFLKALSDARWLLGDPDTDMHITAGNWMLAHHALPFHDPFSNSMPGAHWVVHEWLAELLLASTYDALGWWGLVFLSAGCFALAIALLTRWLMSRLDPLIALVLVALSFVLLLPHLLARPHLLAEPLVVLWCASLFAARDAGRAPSLLILPLMTIWANLHAGYMVGVALTGFLGGEAVLAATSNAMRWSEIRRWGGFTLSALLAAALTPNGLDGLLLPLSFMDKSVMYAYIIEWKSANFDSFGPIELWILLLITGGWSLGLKLPLPRLALLVGITHMTLAHARHMDLIATVCPLAMAAPLGAQIRALFAGQPASAVRQRIAALAQPAEPAGLTAAMTLAVAICALFATHPLVREDGATRPVAALAAAERLHLDGPVLNAQPFGGYLIFRGIKPFIDGRMEMYGEAFLSRYMKAGSGEKPVLDEILKQYGITWTMFQPEDGAVAVLDHEPGWRRVYADQYAVIHARIGAEDAAASAVAR